MQLITLLLGCVEDKTILECSTAGGDLDKPKVKGTLGTSVLCRIQWLRLEKKHHQQSQNSETFILCLKSVGIG